MPIDTVEEVSERPKPSPDRLPFQAADLQNGAVYALGIETAAARMPLLLAPLQAALRAGRPCVLITRLNPEEAPLADVLAQARRIVAATQADAADRLRVFTAIGDYTVNLFLHGAVRYLQELDQFQIAPGSLLLIDEADDLYTPHDHGALVQQTQAYRQWCERHQHTMLQLHLRTHAGRPLLEGNQAAAQHLRGIARVTSQPAGLQMAIDFWGSPEGLRTGSVIPLGPLLSSLQRAPAVDGAAKALPSLWYVGEPQAEPGAWQRQFDVRTAASLAEMLSWRRDARDAGLSIIVTLGSSDEFSDFVEQLAQLRATVGEHAHIVVRESRYRLREHTQKRMLLRAGVDMVLPATHSLEELAARLLMPQIETAVEVNPTPADAIEPCVPLAQDDDAAGWLSRSAFVTQAERRLRRSRLAQVPCALAEVDFTDLPAPDAVIAVKGALQVGRTGDLTTATRGSLFFFLQGCSERDAVPVVTRCMDDTLARRIQRLHLYTGESAIANRLRELRQEAAAETLATSETYRKPAVNGAAVPAATMASWAVLVMALVWPVAESCAQGNPTQPAAAPLAPATTAAQAYEQADYATAARRGLIELQREPGDHELRFKVANSLAWTGQYGPAIEQYGLLAGTPRALAANIGLANVHLWNGRAHLADPLFRGVLNVEPSNADALQGLAAAQRQVRPRSTVRAEALDDSSSAERSTQLIAHRWRDPGLTQIFEVSGERVDESRSPGGPDLRPRKLSVSYQNLAWPLAPKALLTGDSGVKSSVFGSLGLHWADDTVKLDVARVNWGELAFDPRARSDGLAAARVGVAGRFDASIGGFSGSATHFAVSDGNRVAEVNAQYTPAWQPFPLGSGLRAGLGVYSRKAQRRDPRYWSPTSGYNVGQIGVALNQSGAQWDFGAEVKRSQRLGGEGAQGWTVGLAGTRWLSPDWALRFEGLHIETRRDASAYRSKSVAVSLDHLW
jgi:Cellulose biosynthesis GIL